MATEQPEPASTADSRATSCRHVLVLYQHQWTHVKTIAHYLESFHRFSRFNVSYVSSLARCHLDLDFFDAVVLHYSVRVCHPGYLSSSFARALRRYRGLKVLFLQDEYENTAATHDAIDKLGIDLVFTCVPPSSIRQVYPEERFGGVRFVPILTGYVPLDAHELRSPPLSERRLFIGYRGRNLGFWYGDLGREKVTIGMRMKEECDRRGLVTDIAWEEEDRIYGDDWFRFLGNCRATLGTESGSNVFDPDGSLRQMIRKEVMTRPDVPYEEIRARYLEGHEGKVVMNQVSPKVFEAIACRTALVLFEGHYSGVVEPHRHYIPLRKDFGNIDEVLARVGDDDYLGELTERAYREVLQSGRYSYRQLVGFFDDVLEECWPPGPRASRPWLPLPPSDAVWSFRKRYQRNFEPGVLRRFWRYLPAGLRARVHGVVGRDKLESVWVKSPEGLKGVARPVLRLVRYFLRRSH